MSIAERDQDAANIGFHPRERPFVTAYGPKLKVTVDTPPVVPGSRRGAIQSFKNECDINRIMAKYQLSGAIDWVAKHEGQYGDVTGIDFDRAMATIVKAQDMFADLPSSVRNRFQNNPAAFFDFMHDPGNAEEMIKLGLATKRAEPEVKHEAPPA